MASITHLTSEALLEMEWPDDGTRYELSEGELVVVGKAGSRHEVVKSRIVTALCVWSVTHRGARVFSESLFRLGEDTARIPDVAVLLPEKSALVPDADTMLPSAPDLAVEVISVSESAVDAEWKVIEYLAAGVEEVWQVYPAQRLIRVRRSDSLKDVKEDETFTSRVLTDFEVRAQSFFLDEL